MLVNRHRSPAPACRPEHQDSYWHTRQLSPTSQACLVTAAGTQPPGRPTKVHLLPPMIMVVS